MTLLFAISKAVTRRGPVKLSDSRADLQRAIETLQAPKEERKQRRLGAVLPLVSTDRIEEQAATQALETQQGGAVVPPEHNSSLHAESSQSGAKPSSGGGSITHNEE